MIKRSNSTYLHNLQCFPMKISQLGVESLFYRTRFYHILRECLYICIYIQKTARNTLKVIMLPFFPSLSPIGMLFCLPHRESAKRPVMEHEALQEKGEIFLPYSSKRIQEYVVVVYLMSS